jgi:hypothetical protein
MGATASGLRGPVSRTKAEPASMSWMPAHMLSSAIAVKAERQQPEPF